MKLRKGNTRLGVVVYDVCRWYIIFIGENLEVINNWLEELWVALEGNGLRINRSKTKYIKYEFGGKKQEINGTRRVITISCDVIGKVENFEYLGSLV